MSRPSIGPPASRILLSGRERRRHASGCWRLPPRAGVGASSTPPRSAFMAMSPRRPATRPRRSRLATSIRPRRRRPRPWPSVRQGAWAPRLRHPSGCHLWPGGDAALEALPLDQPRPLCDRGIRPSLLPSRLHRRPRRWLPAGPRAAGGGGGGLHRGGPALRVPDRAGRADRAAYRGKGAFRSTSRQLHRGGRERSVEALFVPLGMEPPLHRRRVDFWTKSRAFSIAKARRLLGYDPKVEVEEGIARTAAWYRRRAGCDGTGRTRASGPGRCRAWPASRSRSTCRKHPRVNSGGTARRTTHGLEPRRGPGPALRSARRLPRAARVLLRAAGDLPQARERRADLRTADGFPWARQARADGQADLFRQVVRLSGLRPRLSCVPSGRGACC